MRLALLQLRAAVMAVVVLLLGLVVVAAPANADDSSLPEGFYLCHATGNASGVETVGHWSRQSPNSAGVAAGHIGHQNGNDIIPPIPGLLPAGQNWTAYGQQVHANGCEAPRPAQPQAETRSVPRSESGCAPGGVSSWVDVYTRQFVWNDGAGQWVLGDETGPVRTDESFEAYSDDRYFELCATAKPAPEVRTVAMSSASCAPAGLTAWSDLYTTEYVWSAAQRRWVLGHESGPVKAGETFTAFTDEEYFDECAAPRPAAETRSVPRSESSCEPAGVTSWTDVYTTEYVWSTAQRSWVLGQESGPVPSGQSFTAFTDDEFLDECAAEQPATQTRSVPQSEPSCELGGVTSWSDLYTTEYVWDSAQRAWVLGAERGPSRTGVAFSPYTDEEYVALCAEPQPAPIIREVAGAQASCKIRGTTTWTDVYTTEYVWNVETRAWELGEETGPVRTDETFVEYSEADLAEQCSEVSGETDANVPAAPTAPTGSGADAPVTGPAAAVPTVVNAGAATKIGPSTQNPDPVWLMAFGAGLGLMGAAGLRRRATANR